MKKLRIFPLILILCLLMSLSAPFVSAETVGQVEYTGAPLDAKSAVIADAETGRVLFALDADSPRPMASLTKLMTALCTIEAIGRGDVSLKDEVMATEDCYVDMDPDGSTAGIIAGEVMSLKDLLYCVLLSSANEACNIIAKHVSGSVEDFVALMNERAERLGCTQTHFENTHGLTVTGHQSSARDLMNILREAMSYELFVEIAGTAQYTTAATNISEPRTLQNSNALLNAGSVYGSSYTYEGMICGKTGHTEAAGFCLASAAEHDGVKLICIVLGCEATDSSIGSFVSSSRLYDWAFSNFSYRTLLEKGSRVGTQPVQYGKGAESVELKTETALSALVPEDAQLEQFEQRISLYGDEIRAPIYTGEALGELTLLDGDGNVYGKVKLVAADDVKLAVSQFALHKIGEFFGHTWVKIVLAVIILIVALYIIAAVRYNRRRKRQLEARRRREAERRAREAQQTAQELRTAPARRAEPKTAKEPEVSKSTQAKRDYYAEFFAEEHRRENRDD